MRRLPALATVAFALPTIAACGGGGAPGGAETGFDAQPVAVAGPDLRIGSRDDADFAFRAVGSIIEAPDGAIYSIHDGEAFVRRWSSEGEPVGRVGREGEGPGEFQSTFRFGFFGDSLWVWDDTAYRVTYFDLEGQFLGTVTPRLDLGTRERIAPRPERPLRDGTFFARAPAPSRLITTGELTESEMAWVGADGAELGLMEPYPHRPTDLLSLPRPDGGGTYTRQVLGDQPMRHIGDLGVTMVDRRAWGGAGEAAIDVRRLAYSGDTVAISRVPYDPVPVDVARLDSIAAENADGLWDFISRVQPGLSREGFEREYREAMYRPDFMPPVDEIVVSAQGGVWLREVGGGGASTTWWVLDPSLEPLQKVAVPAGFELKAVYEDRLWGVERDDLDVEYIVRYRYEPLVR